MSAHMLCFLTGYIVGVVITNIAMFLIQIRNINDG